MRWNTLNPLDQVSAPPLASGVYLPQENGRLDQKKNFMKMRHQREPDRPFDARSPDLGRWRPNGLTS
jgi:hypothetical protein